MRPLKCGERANAAEQLDPPESCSVGDGTTPDATSSLVTQYRAARHQLNESVALLARAADLREKLWWGIYDLGDALADVAALRRAVAAHKRERRP